MMVLLKIEQKMSKSPVRDTQSFNTVVNGEDIRFMSVIEPISR